MASYSDNVINAHKFAQSQRAHPSVLEDPFYHVPEDSFDAGPGTLLKLERETDTSLYTIPPNLSMSRFLYQSRTRKGSLVPVSAYVLWPYLARPCRNEYYYQVVAWAHGTSGASPECAPSNHKNLWLHFQAPFQLALMCYVVVATDYAGLGVAKDAAGNPIIHEYLTGSAQANDVIYSILAARTAFHKLSTEFVVMGSSQGGSAAWAFAQEMWSRPMAGHLGTIALSPVTQLSLPLDSDVMPLLLLYLTPTLRENYGPFDPSDIFTPEGLQSLDTITTLQGCNSVLFQLESHNILKSGWHQNASIQKYQAANVYGDKLTRGPLLVIAGEDDPIVTIKTVQKAVKATLKLRSSDLEYHRLPNVNHAPVMYAGLRIYIDWINARFADHPIEDPYYAQLAEPVRPVSAQQTEANWLIQPQTEPWQKT